MEKFLCSSPTDIEKFMTLGQRAQDVSIANLKKDEDYDDAPDEFIGKNATFANVVFFHPVVNFTNILWAHLRQYSCAKKVET